MIEDLTIQLGFWDLLLWQGVFVFVIWMTLMQIDALAVHLGNCVRAVRRAPTWRWLPMLGLGVIAAADAASTEAVRAAHPSRFQEANPLFAHLVETGSAWLAMLTSLPIIVGIGLLFVAKPTGKARWWYWVLATAVVVGAAFRIGVVFHNLSYL